MFTKLARKEEGFTLIELLVVVAIIALLTAFAVPRLFDAINNSKGSRGQADVETISGALERYYMDMSEFPTATSSLTNYLKTNTNYLNGYNREYMYLGAAGFYVLVDPKNQLEGSTITVTCNSHTATGTVVAYDKASEADKTPTALTNAASPNTITATDVGSCTVAATPPSGKSNTGLEAPIVITN